MIGEKEMYNQLKNMLCFFRFKYKAGMYGDTYAINNEEDIEDEGRIKCICLEWCKNTFGSTDYINSVEILNEPKVPCHIIVKNDNSASLRIPSKSIKELYRNIQDLQIKKLSGI